MASKEGWTHEANHNKIQLGTKNYRNMEEWSRPCATCKEKFSIFVRQNSTGVNSNFGYRNCKEHRGMTRTAGEAAMPASSVDREELERLQMVNKTMKEELDALYPYKRELEAEIDVLKAELAKHTLSGAMQETAKKFPWQG